MYVLYQQWGVLVYIGDTVPYHINTIFQTSSQEKNIIFNKKFLTGNSEVGVGGGVGGGGGMTAAIAGLNIKLYHHLKCKTHCTVHAYEVFIKNIFYFLYFDCLDCSEDF